VANTPKPVKSGKAGKLEKKHTLNKVKPLVVITSLKQV
jgi:hypothetical protein